MNTNRLTINNIDLSTVLTEETSAVTGYTVVRSKGGSSKPVKFTGSSKVADFKAIFGEGGKDEPDVYEALTFLNAGYDLYVAAPYKTATVPIAAVTNKGIFMLSDNIKYSDVEDFATGGLFSSVEPGDSTKYMVEVSKLGEYFSGVTVSDPNTGSFTVSGAPTDDSNPNKTLFDEFFNASVFLKLVKKDGTSIDVTGTYTSSSGAVTYTFTGITQEVFENSILYVLSGTTVKNDQNADTKKLSIKGYLFPKFPTTKNTDISFVPPNQTESITIADINSSNVSFSLDNVDNSQPYVCYAEVDAAVDTSEIKSLAPLSFRGCKKDYGDNSDTEKGWTSALEIDDSIDLFFDPVCHDVTSSAPTGAFFGLATQSKYMGLAGYLFNCTVDPDKVSEAPALTYGPNYWSICNQAVINPASTNSFYSSMIGARAVMQARIIERNYGGSAPMYINDSNGLGGQLGSLVGSTKLRYSFKKPDVRQKLADKNYNVVISDPNYGVLITSQMTCKEGTLTDWSYIGHACAFLTLEKLIWDNVMIPQIGKANNPYYRDLRAQQVQRYLDARTGGSNSIWSAATVDTSTAPGVNDVAAQKARKFVIVVKVKVNIFSEEVVLNFINLPQDATL